MRTADSGGGSPDASLAERRRKEEGYRREKEIFPEGADEWQREEHEEAVAHLRQHERQRLEKERESRAEREQRKAAERADRDARKADERSFNLRPGITGPVSMRPGDWICPNPACEVVVYGTRSICFKCKTPWHPGVRCGERADVELEEWRRLRGAQRCPGCDKIIEKDDPETCNHMVHKASDSMPCLRERTDFCYCCGLEVMPDYPHDEKDNPGARARASQLPPTARV